MPIASRITRLPIAFDGTAARDLRASLNGEVYSGSGNGGSANKFASARSGLCDWGVGFGFHGIEVLNCLGGQVRFVPCEP